MRRLFAIVIASLLPIACAKVEVDEPASFCLAWPDGGVPFTPASIPSELPCAVVTTSQPNAGVTPTSPGARLAYVCIAADDGACPVAADAHATIASCTESKSGDGCDHPLSGACTTVSDWSICGADPDATGACCYYVWTVASTFYS